MSNKPGRGGTRISTRPDQRKRGPMIKSNRDAPLDAERARAMKILIISRGWEYTPDNWRKILNELIDAAYEDYERPILAAAEAEGLIV